jgi:acyl-homoserine lactone acylase PvdQ
VSLTVRTAFIALAVLLVAAGASAGASTPLDRAILARDVLPPGNYGGVDFQKTSQDQIPLYDNLTAKFNQVTAKDIQTDFKAEPLWDGTEKAVRVEHPGRGVQIKRDAFDVPHVFGKTETDVFYGTGYAAAEDRGVLMELARGPGRLACIDAPGYNAFTVALTGKQFKPSPATEAYLAKQIAFLQNGGAQGHQELRDIDAYVAGINAQHVAANLPITPWTRNDVVAATCLLGARFGAGGGDELRRSEFLDALQKKLGSAKGLSVFDDLGEQNDPEAPTTLSTAFPFGPQTAASPGSGNEVVDDASAQDPSPDHASMSNALLVSGKRSTTGHPLMVAGPQLGYFYPEFFWEVDMEDGGVHVRGGSLAGIPNVLIGRGTDYGWSFTSANSDNIDTFAETLCGGDDHHYLYKGQCAAMTHVDAGTIIAQGQSSPVTFWETVHGPVLGYGTVHGTRVALASDRTTRGRELNAALDVYDLSTGRTKSAQQFVHDLSRFEMVFNGFYVDSNDIAYVSCGRLPVRAPGVDPALPTVGTGAYDWRGFLAPAQHPSAIDPKNGQIVNWNNKPAPKFAAADDKWSYGSIYRVQLLERGVKPGKNSPLDLVRAMNTAATQDLRAVLVWPDIDAMLAKTPAPTAQDEQMRQLVNAWVKAGGSRLDRDLDGKIDDPGAAILDKAWPEIADAVMSPVLGSLTDRLAQLMAPDQAPGPNGSASEDGWYGYIDKDLRTLLGNKVNGPFANHYCGAGDVNACSQALWAAVDTATPAIGTRSDATVERIQFAPGFLRATMRWTNRPTYQQILSFR